MSIFSPINLFQEILSLKTYNFRVLHKSHFTLADNTIINLKFKDSFTEFIKKHVSPFPVATIFLAQCYQIQSWVGWYLHEHWETGHRLIFQKFYKDHPLPLWSLYKLPSLENFWWHNVLQCVLKYEIGYFPIHPQTAFTCLTNFIWLTAANSFSIALQGGITCYEII
jgi:hypothetical protein